MREVTVYENAGHDAVTSLIIQFAEPDDKSMASKSPRTKRMSDGATIALRALKKTIDDVGEQKVANDIPRGVRGATVEQWRTRSYLAGICNSDKIKTREKAFKRSREALLAAGTVVEWNGFVWIPKDLKSEIAKLSPQDAKIVSPRLSTLGDIFQLSPQDVKLSPQDLRNVSQRLPTLRETNCVGGRRPHNLSPVFVSCLLSP